MESDCGENRIVHGFVMCRPRGSFHLYYRKTSWRWNFTSHLRLNLKCCPLVGLLITTFKERATEDGKKVAEEPVTVGCVNMHPNYLETAFPSSAFLPRASLEQSFFFFFNSLSVFTVEQSSSLLEKEKKRRGLHKLSGVTFLQHRS